MKNSSILFSVAALLLLITPTLNAQDMTDKEMSAEEQKMMENFAAYSTPNEHHEILKKLSGNWDAKISHWMSADAQPEVSTGDSVGTMTMNGRFLEQNFSGSWMNQPFNGRAIYGYDNIKKSYTSLWYDNMGTGIMIGSGHFAQETQSISESGELSCPITNGQRSFKAVTTFVDDDHFNYELYMPGMDGEFFRAMIIEYSRKS